LALLEVARIARAHGLRGEVVVQLLTNRVERLQPDSELVVRPVRELPGGSLRRLTVRSARPFQSRWLVVFDGVTRREEADELHGATLLAEPIEDPDELFVHELIGSVLVDQHGIAHGTITAVQANPASDLLVVDDGHFVPVRFVISSGGGTVRVEVPEGLFDL
jgi:16S rRNA processing protein RimM